jgi:ribonuclease T1
VRRGRRGRRRVPGLVLLVALLVVVGAGLAVAGAIRGHGAPDLRSCAVTGLPAQVATTVGEIRGGGPYPYREDDEVFDNREHRLPGEPSSYYHEFTVVTPGSPDRGTRRVISAGPPGAGATLYYTGNHYASFCRITTP